jgi:hypothetical protein
MWPRLAAAWSLPWLVLLAPSTVAAAPPPGQSALLNGMHDIESLGWMVTATDGCDKGWITDLQYIGQSGSAAGACRTEATDQGISILMRLDVDGGRSFPTSAADVAGYAGAFADFVGDCAAIHVWIVGNEPNFTVNHSDPDCSSSAYADAYLAVHAAVHALAGHENDLVLVAPNSPYSPGCVESLRSIAELIQAQGVTPDGFALHAYTRAPDAGTLDASYVTSTATQNDATIDECPGGATWNDTWHSQFLIVQDYIAAIEALGLAGSPVFITESGNACDVVAGNDCYPDANLAYFQALYAWAAQHNAGAATKIRAITPYRWTGNDDGTGRDFEIGARPQLLADLLAAFAAKPSWTDVGCGQPPQPCTQDEQCAPLVCDVPSGQCVAPNPDAGSGGGTAGGGPAGGSSAGGGSVGNGVSDADPAEGCGCRTGRAGTGSVAPLVLSFGLLLRRRSRVAWRLDCRLPSLSRSRLHRWYFRSTSLKG